MLTNTQHYASFEKNLTPSPAFLVFTSSAPEETGNDALAEAHQQLFSLLLEAFFRDQDRDEDNEAEDEDDMVPASSLGLAARCEQLTSDIIELERLRQIVARMQADHIGAPESFHDLLQLLWEAYERKIIDCEGELDRVLEPNRRRYARCGVIADYYVG